MNDVEFCKQRLAELTETSRVDNLAAEVDKFLNKRLPGLGKQRACKTGDLPWQRHFAARAA
jgi:hypothetical protein